METATSSRSAYGHWPNFRAYGSEAPQCSRGATDSDRRSIKANEEEATNLYIESHATILNITSPGPRIGAEIARLVHKKRLSYGPQHDF